MSRWITRGGAFFLAAILCMTMFAGCSSGKKPEKTSGNTSTQENSTNGEESLTSEDESLAGEEQSNQSDTSDVSTVGSSKGTTTTKKGSSPTTQTAKINLKGRTLTIAVFGGAEAFTNKDESVYYNAFRATEKQYNCKIKVVTVPIVELITKVEQAAIAGTAPYDAAMVEGYRAIPEFALSGQYLCLSDYVSFNDKYWNDEVVKDVGIFKGKRYSFPMEPASPTGIYYNKKLVKAANLPDPWTYVKKGTWNWATFKTFAKALTKDSNNDGRPEQFGFISENPFYEFIMTNGGQIIDVSTGAGQLKIGEAKAKEAIQYVMDLYNQKIIPDPEMMAKSGIESAFQGMTTGKVAMFPYHIGYGPYLVNQAKFKAADVGWVYFPTGNQKKSYVSPIASPTSQLMVLKNVKQPKEVVTVLKTAMTYWDTSKSYGISFNNQCKLVADRDMYLDFLTGNHLTMYQNLLSKTQCYNTLSYTDANNMLLTMFFEIREKKYTIASGIDAYKSKVQQAIKDAEKAS